MIKHSKSLFMGAFLLLTSLALAVPTVIIVKQPGSSKTTSDINLDLMFAVSQEVYDEGKMVPIVWSNTDPIFRAAIDDKVLVDPSDNPSAAEVLAAAKKLKIDYIFVIKASFDKGSITGEIAIQKESKVIWQDKKSMQISVGNALDKDNTFKSIARTWMLAVNTTLFKDLPSSRRDTPVLDKGQEGPKVTIKPPVKVDNKTLATEATRLAKSGDTAGLVILLRDAVDAEPLDVERRRMLIEFLMARGETMAAGDEAQRSALVLPESTEFHVLAARAYMQSGDSEKAQSELNEALARDAESFEARLLMGELSLLKGDLKISRDHLDAAMKKGTTPDVFYKRALVLALLGESDAAKIDFEQSTKTALSAQEIEQRYRFGVAVVDKRVDLLIQSIRTLVQKARVKPDNLGDTVKSLKLEVSGLNRTNDLLVPPDIYKRSHAMRVLAATLLDQCMNQIEQAFADKDMTSLNEVTINLSEANRQSTAAKQAFLEESSKTNGG